MKLFFVALAAAAVYAFLAAPRRLSRMNAFLDFDYAHRGLFDNLRDAPENSLNAFERAIAHGLGIEMDVRLTGDGVPVVFHDDSLERACGDSRRVEDVTLRELRELTLFDSDERIPTLSEALERIAGRVPLIVEIKHEKRFRESARKTVQILRDYGGLSCVESFNPLILNECRRMAPEIARGQLSAGFRDCAEQAGVLAGLVFSNLLINFLSRPDFIAYDVLRRGAWQLWVQRHVFRTTIAWWTIRTEEQALETTDKGYIRICEWFENAESSQRT